MRRTAGQRRHRETTGVAVAVEHALKLPAPRMLGKLLAAVALVQVKAGLMAFGNVQAELPIMLADDDLGAGAAAFGRAAEPACGFGQAFEAAHTGV